MNEIGRKIPIVLLMIAIVVITCSMSFSCTWLSTHKLNYLITKTGISNLIEIYMTLSEFKSKNMPFARVDSPFSWTGRNVYAINQTGIEFETYNDEIVRIWFFTKDNHFRIFLNED